jgi:hypothetical protein
MRQFDQLRATELFCPQCRAPRPVRERLLLVLPHAELYEYRCVACASSLGQREVKGSPLASGGAATLRPPTRRAAGHPAAKGSGPRLQLGGRRV